MTSNNYQDASDDQTIRTRALEDVEAGEVAEATEVNEAGEDYQGWKITTEDFIVIQVLEFNDLRIKITVFWCFEQKKFWRQS